ncbi:MAG: cupin domain-containing protein [Phycisphaerales bacterium]
MNETINIAEKLALFDELWTPKIIGELNGQQVKLAKLQGELMWHAHEDEDELFLVLDGELTIEMRDRSVHLKKGEMYIVPRGVEHNPIANNGASVLLFEPAQTKHTGVHMTERTVVDQQQI